MKKRLKSESYIQDYINKAVLIINKLNQQDINKMINELVRLKKRKGRLFLLGVGGSGANCSHAVNDFRKICNIEAYTPIDNVSELTARINDDGWETIFENWLKGCRLNKDDAVLVFSVGGGDLKKRVSINIVKALQYAKKVNTVILGIVGRDGGYTYKAARVTILIPTLSRITITPFVESLQALIWHAIVNHPLLCNK